MNTLVKALCIVAYVLGTASVAGMLPESFSIAAKIAAVLLAAHLVETIVMFKAVKRYPGSLGTSIVLSMLFGLAHWKPLMRK